MAIHGNYEQTSIYAYNTQNTDQKPDQTPDQPQHFINSIMDIPEEEVPL